MTIKCSLCGLYAKQINPLPILKQKLEQPCKDFQEKPSFEVHVSHEMWNLGHAWVCLKCGFLQKVSSPFGESWKLPCSPNSKKKETAALKEARQAKESRSVAGFSTPKSAPCLPSFKGATQKFAKVKPKPEPKQAKLNLG